jgi:hypothetical protein
MVHFDNRFPIHASHLAFIWKHEHVPLIRGLRWITLITQVYITPVFPEKEVSWNTCQVMVKSTFKYPGLETQGRRYCTTAHLGHHALHLSLLLPYKLST